MRKGLLATLAVALLVFGWGCQNTSIDPASTSSEQQIDLDSPTGGLTATDEAPAFGESDKFAIFSDESAADDPLERDAGYRDDILTARGARIYDFRAIWGRLAFLPDTTAPVSCPIDWSGTLHLDGGVIIMEKVIAFERNDSIWRVDRSTIEWISHTGPRFDGIQVKLVVPARSVDSLDCANCAPQLVLKAGPYSRTFTLDELAALSVITPIDRCGNEISITSVLAPPACPHGQLAGVWENTAVDSTASAETIGEGGSVLGIFRGVWVGRHGLIGGYLKGVYGLNSAGEAVFFGKYIDLQGHFMGILRGTYGSRPVPTVASNADSGNRRRGWFAGEWIDGNVNVQGKLKGHWIAVAKGVGFFHGIWGMRCSEGTEGDVDNCRGMDD
jgi:hypothetical protein